LLDTLGASSPSPTGIACGNLHFALLDGGRSENMGKNEFSNPGFERFKLLMWTPMIFNGCSMYNQTKLRRLDFAYYRIIDTIHFSSLRR